MCTILYNFSTQDFVFSTFPTYNILYIEHYLNRLSYLHCLLFGTKGFWNFFIRWSKHIVTVVVIAAAGILMVLKNEFFKCVKEARQDWSFCKNQIISIINVMTTRYITLSAGASNTMTTSVTTMQIFIAINTLWGRWKSHLKGHMINRILLSWSLFIVWITVMSRDK